jgi:CubicO group peptidase (beta-lactamase class C family)
MEKAHMRPLPAALLAAFLSALPAAAFADERAAADYSARHAGVSFIAIKDGETLHEAYPNGGGAQKAHELASGTKSFSGVIAAVAVKDGLLTLDERAADTLGEWKDDPRKSKITIRQLLSLTSGVEGGRIGRPPAYQDAVALPAIAEPGTVFEYGPVNFQIFGEIMKRKLQSYEGGRYADALAYLEARILAPLGVKPAQWNRGRDGDPHLPSGADLTAREWARFGKFILDGGAVDGALLVDEAAFAAMFEGSAVNPGYGLSWWLKAEPSKATLDASRTMTVASDLFTHPRRNELPADLVMAAGAGDQRLYIIPSMSLVVVRQTDRLFMRSRAARRYSDVEFLLALLAP